MIDMPPLRFAKTNGIRMGYYEAGPEADGPPLVLCHGWPELAFAPVSIGIEHAHVGDGTLLVVRGEPGIGPDQQRQD